MGCWNDEVWDVKAGALAVGWAVNGLVAAVPNGEELKGVEMGVLTD